MQSTSRLRHGGGVAASPHNPSSGSPRTFERRIAYRLPRFGRISVRIDRSILRSDEACVAAIGHEMHELNELRRRFANAPNKTMKFRHFQSLVDADLNGSLHLEALRVSNELILKMRQKKL